MKTTNFLASRAVAISIFSFAIISCNDGSDTADGAGADTTATTAAAASSDSLMHSDTGSVPLQKTAMVTLSGTYPDTAVTGTAKFTAADNGKVDMELELSIPAKAGKNVAVHFHEHGDCGDNGKSAHGHWNPTKEDHGKWGTAPYHRGDIGNVKLDSKGKGSTRIQTDLWTLGGTAEKNILGKALIIHGGTDDYKTQPTGNAGSRIGCGVVQ
jgi:superoxide dismutase, Cu-Zn family